MIKIERKFIFAFALLMGLFAGCTTTDPQTVMILSRRINDLERAQHLRDVEKLSKGKTVEEFIINGNDIRRVNRSQNDQRSRRATFDGGLNEKQREFIEIMMEYLGDDHGHANDDGSKSE